jgi:hypothetical protein
VSHFQFNGDFYDQVDGVAMGSPLGPLFANVFMSNFETKHVQEMKRLGLKRWKRYVDDVFATFNREEQSNQVLAFLNAQHANIKFTLEKENNNQLPFLDISVIRTRTKYKTTLYRKKTFTGVYLNWTSLTSRKYKIGLIHCLLDRIWRICAEEKDRKDEVEKLRAILEKNEYPVRVINKEIELFVLRKKEKSKGGDKEKPPTVEKTRRFIVLPYTSRQAEQFGLKMKATIEKNFGQVQFSVIFKAPDEIGKRFPFKDNIKNVESKSLVVYHLKCQNCEADYIGKSQRILCHRIKEHRMNKSSACKQHEMTTGHRMDYSNVEILDSADNDFKLKLKELLHIVKRKPILNKQLNSQSNYEIKTLIITAYPQYSEVAST